MKEKIIRRRMVGLFVMAGGRAHPSAHVVYEVDCLVGPKLEIRTKLERGHTIYGLYNGGECAKTKKVVAIKALANKLARASFYILRDQSAFDEKRLYGYQVRMPPGVFPHDRRAFSVPVSFSISRRRESRSQ